ncbi:hypothetical protein DFP72DRAFT_1090517 [Ephemerocybe angulata]|uniref:Nephrocystin 3-like N-terminal domain-containing protein n=1 Tax=Ephemerocybe angulata TaxID=980116 RepID=A0A8H6I9H1_9AGAR|nr:hypothetical protein DFP72DRAFT_1090517 [Tulosesus angulatus]
MNPGLHVARVSADHMDVDRPQGGPQFFSGASNITARDITVHTAGRDMINNIVVNPAPISASIEEVTAWLKGANFRAIYRLSLETRMDNTGRWFIATFEFGEFVRQKGTVVWATGFPGSGKTILASISVQHLEEKFSGRADIAILYAFLRYSEKPNLLQIIAGFLTQLVRCHCVAFSHLLPIYLRAKMHQDELSFSDAVKLLKGSLDMFQDAFIVIDGLDEGMIRRRVVYSIFLPDCAQTRDIEVYVTERIKESPKLVLILAEHPEIAENFTALIQEKSKGMFLLAKLQMELVLERCATIGSLLKALETLPSGINEMYHLTMARINSLPKEEVSIAHRAFLWILHARRVLFVKDLQHALTFSYEDKQFVEDNSVSIPVLLSICCGLVTVENTDFGDYGKKDIRFIHYSTQEFMKDLAFPHLPDPHNLLSVTCVACVEPHLAMLMKPGSWPFGRALDVALLAYAVVFWGYHAKICDDRQDLNPFILSFLSKHRTYAMVRRLQVSEVSQGLGLAAAYDLANLISSRTLPYSPTPGTVTPFHIAAEHGHISSLRALLKNYSGVHVRDKDGRTPLHHCVLPRSQWESDWEPESVQQLLSLSPSDTWRAFPSEVVDINAQDEQGQTAFWEACRNVTYLKVLSLESLIDSTSPQGKILRIFTSHHGIEVDLPDSRGDTPFSRACVSRNSGVAQFLITAIPNLEVDTRNKWGETPFMHACDAQSETMVEWFLSRAPGGCHFLRQEDNEGNTALERIVACEGMGIYRGTSYGIGVGVRELCDKIIRILSEYTHVRMVWDVHSLSTYRLRTSSTHQSPTVHVCLEDDHRRYAGERTSLMLLANYPGAVMHLASGNKDNPGFMNAQDIDGRSALMYACFGQDHNIGARLSVGIFTSCPSVNVHLRDRDGMSALDYALYSKNIDALEVLIDHPSWNNPANRSAAITAAQKRFRNIDPGALESLLNTQSVQGAFEEAGDSETDGCALMTALRPSRRVDCKNILEKLERGIFWREEEDSEEDEDSEDDEEDEEDEEEEDEEEEEKDDEGKDTEDDERDEDNLEEHPDGHTLAAIRQATIAAVNNPLTSIEQLESHFRQKEVKDAFVWDIGLRDPDTILLINCLAWRSGCSALFDDLFGPLKRCEGRHRACVHALIRFN